MLGVIILFFLLSPGVLLTIPPLGRGLFMSGQTSMMAAAVHAVVFAFVMAYKRQIPGLSQLMMTADSVF